jgi:drug/metabolite transporter (DMT)-like permease
VPEYRTPLGPKTAARRRSRATIDPMVTPEPSARRVLTTADGTRAHAFGPAEWALLAVPAVIWGCSFLLIAIAVEDLAPATLTMLRIGFGALALAALPATRRPVPRAEWPALALVSLTWMALPFYCFSVAEQWIDSSLAGMLNGAMPLMTAAIAALLLRRRPGARQVTGLLVGFAGVVVVMLPALDDGSATAHCR